MENTKELMAEIVEIIDNMKDKINSGEYVDLMDKLNKVYKKKEEEELYEITYMELEATKNIDNLLDMEEEMGFEGGAEWIYKKKICSIDKGMETSDNPNYCPKRILIEENGGKWRERYNICKCDEITSIIKFKPGEPFNLLSLPSPQKLIKKIKYRSGIFSDEDDYDNEEPPNVLVSIPYLIILNCKKI